MTCWPLLQLSLKNLRMISVKVYTYLSNAGWQDDIFRSSMTAQFLDEVIGLKFSIAVEVIDLT